MFENVELMQRIAQELIDYTPGHFTNIDLEVTQCPRHERGRLVYRISTAQLVIATRVTRDEMEWTFENGRPALTEKLVKAGVGKVSDLTRRSVLT